MGSRVGVGVLGIGMKGWDEGLGLGLGLGLGWPRVIPPVEARVQWLRGGRAGDEDGAQLGDRADLTHARRPRRGDGGARQHLVRVRVGVRVRVRLTLTLTLSDLEE